MSSSERPEEWSRLLNGLADDCLTGEQERRLAELCRSDVKFRREYVAFCQLVTMLAWQSSADITPLPGRSSPIPGIDLTTPSSGPGNARSKTVRSMRTGWAIFIVSALLVVFGFLWLGRNPSSDNSLGRITSVVGRVEVTRGNQAPVTILAEGVGQNSWALQAQDRLRIEHDGMATLTLADLTEIDLRPDTRLALSKDRGVRLDLLRGGLKARVTPQRAGDSLKIVTPHAEVGILGTELELFATPTQTEVGVVEGRVRVTRTSDGASAEVSAAQILTVAETGGLSVSRWPQPPDEWSEDFERGQPPGWTGRLVRDGLPERSRGAIRAVLTLGPRGAGREIRSPVEEDGLFAWHADTVLHLTFKVQPPAWFHVYLLALDCSRPESSLTCRVVKPDLWQTLPGEWRTISLPLSEFQVVSGGPDEPALGRIPVQIVLSGGGDSAGVEIDRVWVDRSDSPAGRGTTEE